jgi:hypothetical protein
MIEWRYDDGGRSAAGFRGDTGDCVTRAAAIVTGRPYREIYDLVNELGANERRRTVKRSRARTGVQNDTTRKLMAALGLEWTPTMAIGQGCTVHLRADELPSGAIVVKLSRHVAAVLDGVLHDTYDGSRDGTRCVYGYWREESVEPLRAE